ncbi:TPA: restriction endonuclease subunit S [Vibrio cholerae]|nr:restriction endonuclease subunit S [Vibrio cholerae]HAS3409691.1 restriction endonuclease subunit S [Vibrio cholerae]
MAGRYKAYPEYKDSGIDWLGEIPESWIALPIKRVSSFTTGMTPSTAVSEYYADDETDYEWIRPEDIKETSESVSASKFLTNLGWKTQRVVPAQSSLICCIGTIGKTGYSLKPVTTNQQITAATFNLSPKYYFYVLLAARAELEQMATGNVVQILNTERLGRLYVPFITENEALKIANFLDHETAKIDTLIAKQEKLIELLKEKRQAVISHAVTKGLNPDAPMKDSGVEWLGEVPEHWVVKRLKFSAKLLASKVAGTDARTIIALENIESSTGRYISTNSSYADDGVVAEAGDVLFGKLRPYLSKVFLCNEPSVAFGDLLAYRPKVGTVAQYLFYSMISGGFIEIVDSSTYGAKMPRASADFINEMRIALPPITEQETIVNQLKDDLSAFDALAVKANDAIKLMQERKTALISAAVTGKIDVSDWELKGDL